MKICFGPSKNGNVSSADGGQATEVPATNAVATEAQAPNAPVTEAPATDASSTESFCDDRADGHYADPADCSRFYQCAHGLTYGHSCAAGLLWNSDIGACDWPRNVICNQAA